MGDLDTDRPLEPRKICRRRRRFRSPQTALRSGLKAYRAVITGIEPRGATYQRRTPGIAWAASRCAEVGPKRPSSRNSGQRPAAWGFGRRAGRRRGGQNWDRFSSSSGASAFRVSSTLSATKQLSEPPRKMRVAPSSVAAIAWTRETLSRIGRPVSGWVKRANT